MVRLSRLVLAASLVLVLPTLAQPGPGGGGGGGGRGGMMGGAMGDLPATITRRELNSYADLLRLNADQKEAAKTLFEGYQAAIRTQTDAMDENRRSIGEKFREGDREGGMQLMREQMTKLRDERAKIEKSFTSDLQALLTPEQAGQWSRFERTRRRDATIARGRLSGEGVDLVRVVDEAALDADAKAKAQPVLEEYEDALDKELTRRNAAYDAAREAMSKAFQEGNPESGQKSMEEARAAGVKVRDLNKAYARRLLDVLPEDKKLALDLAVKKASFPRVYREAHPSKELAAAAGFSDLDPSQKDGIKALQESYHKQLSAANDKLAKATEERELSVNLAQMGQRRGPGQNGQDGQRGQRMRGGPPEDDNPALVEARTAKDELNRATAESLRKLLNPGQIDRLPKPTPQNDRQRRRGRDDEGDPEEI